MARTHRILIVGVGSIGQRHLRCFQATGRAELSLCETNTQLRRQIAEQYAVDRAYADLDAALSDPHDAVVIATPAQLHVPMAIKLAEAGLHLLIEKPLSTSLEGIDSLKQLIQRKHLVVAVAYVYHAHPAFQEMKQAVEAGRFGRPVQVIANCGQHFPTYRPAYRDIYYTDRATGGGAVQDAITHVINAAEWLVGPIDRLVADVAHQVLEGVEVEDTVHVIARHGNIQGCYSLNQHQAPNETTLTVVCHDGTCRFEFHKNRWRWMTEPGGDWHDEDNGPLERDALFTHQADAFLNALEGTKPPLCTLDEGVQTLRVNLAILESSEQQSWQTIRE